MSVFPEPQIPSSAGGPAWEVAMLFPPQGQWDESDYFRVQTNRMIELVDGTLETLPMPTWLHQMLVRYLCRQLEDQIETRLGGMVLFAPLPVRLFPGTIREPDVLYCLPQNVPADANGYPDRIDLVIEIVSEGDAARHRDYIAKRADYAKAGIAEYWIVDPETQVISRLVLENGKYIETAFQIGESAASLLFPEFKLDVTTVFQIRSTKPSGS